MLPLFTLPLSDLHVVSDNLKLLTSSKPLHYCMFLHLILLVIFCYAVSPERSCVDFLKQTKYDV